MKKILLVAVVAAYCTFSWQSGVNAAEIDAGLFDNNAMQTQQMSAWPRIRDMILHREDKYHHPEPTPPARHHYRPAAPPPRHHYRPAPPPLPRHHYRPAPPPPLRHHYRSAAPLPHGGRPGGLHHGKPWFRR